jgi:hypothetical protein
MTRMGPRPRTDDDLRGIIEAQPRNPVTGCWEWAGGLRNGYGVLGHNRYAHRIAYRLFKGDPTGLYVCHHCDNRRCVNPEHLFLGTQKDNLRDMVRKGRHMSQTRPDALRRGERHPKARLCETDIREIRKRLSEGETQQAVADSLGVGQTAISAIKRGTRWGHVR